MTIQHNEICFGCFFLHILGLRMKFLKIESFFVLFIFLITTAFGCSDSDSECGEDLSSGSFLPSAIQVENSNVENLGILNQNEVRFIVENVGAGNRTFLIGEKGMVVVDAGKSEYCQFEEGTFLNNETDYIKNLERLSFIVTHEDHDHYSYIPELLKMISNIRGYDLPTLQIDFYVGGTAENTYELFNKCRQELNKFPTTHNFFFYETPQRVYEASERGRRFGEWKKKCFTANKFVISNILIDDSVNYNSPTKKLSEIRRIQNKLDKFLNRFELDVSNYFSMENPDIEYEAIKKIREISAERHNKINKPEIVSKINEINQQLEILRGNLSITDFNQARVLSISEIQQNLNQTLGSGSFNFLIPINGLLNPAKKNSQSLVFTFEHNGSTVLFTGDATGDTLEGILGHPKKSTKNKKVIAENFLNGNIASSPEEIISAISSRNRDLLRHINLFLNPHHGAEDKGCSNWLPTIIRLSQENFCGAIFSAPGGGQHGHPRNWIDFVEFPQSAIGDKRKLFSCIKKSKSKEKVYISKMQQTSRQVYETCIVPYYSFLFTKDGIVYENENNRPITSLSGWSLYTQKFLDMIRKGGTDNFYRLSGAIEANPRLLKLKDSKGKYLIESVKECDDENLKKEMENFITFCSLNRDLGNLYRGTTFFEGIFGNNDISRQLNDLISQIRTNLSQLIEI